MAAVLGNVILDVRDLERSLKFYQGWLGLPVALEDALEGHRLAYLATGDTMLLLVQQPLADQNPHGRPSGVVLKFYVQNLSALAKSFERQSGDILRHIEKSAPSEHSMLVTDPDGNTLLLAERSQNGEVTSDLR